MDAILEAYYAMEAEIDALIANEADDAANAGASNTTQDTGNDGTGFRTNPNENTNRDSTNSDKTSKISALGNTIHSKIAEAIEKLQTFIMKAIKRMKNFFQRMLVSDKGFENKLRERQKDVKPLAAVNVTTYTYKEGWLQAEIQKMTQIVTKCFNDIQRCSDPRNPTPPETEYIKQPIDKVVPMIVQELAKGADADDVVDIPTYFRYMQNQYRGKKGEITYKQVDLNALLARSRSYNTINLDFQRKLERAGNFANQMNTRKNLLKSQDCSDEQKRDFLTYVNKGMKVYSMYENTLRYAYELELERCLAARVIVQRFYQF